jgi:ribonuclease BN (tRNA processing enzyme)
MFGDHIENAFELREYDPEATLEIGPLAVRFRPVPHFIPAQAVELSEGGRRLTFSSDCGPNTQLCDFARDTDLLLIEASVTEADAAQGGERGHLTPREAGEHGRRAGARRVVLTHVTDELDAGTVLAQGAAGYGAPVELAAEHATYDI